MKQSFLLLLNELLLEVSFLLGKRSVLLGFHHGLVLRVVFVHFVHVTFEGVNLSNLVKDRIATVTLVSEENKLSQRLSFEH